MKGDFKRYKENREDYIKHIPNNDRSGYYLDYIDNGNTLTPKDLYKILGHQLHRFNKSKTFQNIRKDGFDYSMIRVTEPHKDGVPHFHILMYIPQQYMLRVFNEFEKCFLAPQNHKKLISNKKYSNSRDGVEIGQGIFETYGYQIQVRSAAGYILKYILKSFTNLIEDKEVDYLQAWYVHNRIPRIITTHTLISQEVYHQVSILDNDWYYLTNIKIDGNYKRDKDNNYFKFDDGMGRKIIGDNGYYLIINAGKIVSSYGSKINTLRKVRLRSLRYTSVKPKSFNMLERFTFYIPEIPYSYYIKKNFNDGSFFSFGNTNDFFLQSANNQTVFAIANTSYFSVIEDTSYFPDNSIFELSLPSEYLLSVVKMTDFSLLEHYREFDFDLCNPARYALVNNELIDRGLMIAKYLNPNDFNSGFYDD